MFVHILLVCLGAVITMGFDRVLFYSLSECAFFYASALSYVGRTVAILSFVTCVEELEVYFSFYHVSTMPRYSCLFGTIMLRPAASKELGFLGGLHFRQGEQTRFSKAQHGNHGAQKGALA